MTKPRRPLTPYRALARIADLLGWDGAAEVIEKSEWTVRKLSDPDAGRKLSFQDAIRLDAAFRRAGGQGAPLFECYAGRLELLAEVDADHGIALLDSSGKAAKETGEAVAAALAAASNANCAVTRMRALVEVEEGMEALQALHHRLNMMGEQG
ncbi:MAG: hypothetical protein CMH85_10600 [Novosphingobium sp.]|nr:hypothetical protein [Novosphingobium sp.]